MHAAFERRAPVRGSGGHPPGLGNARAREQAGATVLFARYPDSAPHDRAEVPRDGLAPPLRRRRAVPGRDALVGDDGERRRDLEPHSPYHCKLLWPCDCGAPVLGRRLVHLRGAPHGAARPAAGGRAGHRRLGPLADEPVRQRPVHVARAGERRRSLATYRPASSCSPFVISGADSSSSHPPLACVSRAHTGGNGLAAGGTSSGGDRCAFACARCARRFSVLTAASPRSGRVEP